MAENPKGIVLNEAFSAFITEQLKAQGQTPEQIKEALDKISLSGGQIKPMDMLAMAAKALGAPAEATELLNAATGGQLTALAKYGPFAVPMAARKFVPGLYFKVIDFIERKIPFIGPLLEKAHLWVNGVLDSNSMLSIPVKLVATMFRLGEADDRPRPQTAEALREAAANMPILGKGKTATEKQDKDKAETKQEQKPDALADMLSESNISRIGYDGFIKNLSLRISCSNEDHSSLQKIANGLESFVNSIDPLSAELGVASAHTAMSSAIKAAKKSSSDTDTAKTAFRELLNNSFTGKLFKSHDFALIFSGLCSAYSNDQTPAATFLTAISDNQKYSNLNRESVPEREKELA